MSALGNLSIRRKIPLSFAAVLILVFGLGLLSIERLSAVNDSASTIRNEWLPSTAQTSRLVMAIYHYRMVQARYLLQAGAGASDDDLVGVAKELTDADQQVKTARKNFEPLIVPGSDEARATAEADKAWAAYMQDAQKLLDLIQSHDLFNATSLFNGQILTDFQQVLKDFNADLDFNVENGRHAAEAGASIYKETRLLIVGALVVVAALCLLLGALLVAGVSTPLQRITEALHRLAGENLNTEIPGTGRSDEIGAMAAAAEIFRDRMIEADRLGVEQREEHQKKTARADRIAALNNDFDRAARQAFEQLAGSAAEMRNTAGDLSNNADLASKQSGGVTAAADDASTNVQTVAAAAEELTASIQEISHQVVKSSQVAGQAVQEAANTRETMEALAGAAQKIGEIVGLISSIAAQTNLLALNATIEAARAGEAGKGFAVVATEVKSLATQTARATEDIGAQVADMQGAANAAVAAITRIDATIASINEISGSIAAAMEEQGAATQEISRNVQEASRGTAEVSSNIAGLNQIIEQTGAASVDVLTAADRLSREADALKTEVGKFLAEIRSA